MEDRKQSNKSSLICANNRRPVETREVYLGTPLLKNIFWYMDLFFWTRLRSIRIDHKSNFKASSLKSWRSLTTEVSLTTTFWNFFSHPPTRTNYITTDIDGKGSLIQISAAAMRLRKVSIFVFYGKRLFGIGSNTSCLR